MESMDSRFRSAAEIGTAPRIAGEMSASPPEPLLSSPAVWKALACVGRLRPLLASRGVDGLLLFLVALAIRLPFQTTVLYHWDSVLYARALAGFDVSESRPHPPGYLLYVGAARLAQLVLHDANASLVAVSQLGGALAVVFVYLLARQFYGRATALLAALLLATAPSFWYYSGVAYPYTVLASGSVGLAALGVAYWRGSGPPPTVVWFLYGLAGGFRLDLLPFLAPLFGVALLARWWRTRTLWDLVVPLPSAAAGVLLWLVPTVLLSQGWETYWPLLSQQGRYVESSYSVWSRGWPAFQSNSWQVLVYAAEGLQLAVVPLLYGVLHSGWAWWRRQRTGGAERRGGAASLHWAHAPAGLVLGLWLTPPILFYILVHIGDRGYSFSYLPGLCIAAAAGTRRLAASLAKWWQGRRWPILLLRCGRPWLLYLGLLLVLIGGNLGSFLFGHSRLSAYEMDCVNRTMAQSVAIVRERFDPADTLLFSAFFYQHARYYLPEFSAWWYDPLTRPVFRAPLPAGVRQVVVFGEGLLPARQPNLSFYPLACGRRLYYFYDLGPEAQLVFQPPLLRVRSQP